MFNPTLCRNLLWRETSYFTGTSVFWFLAERGDDAFDERLCVLVSLLNQVPVLCQL